MRTGRVAAVADRLEHGLAAQSGQHEVEHDEVDRASALDGLDRRAAVTDDGDRVAVALEVEAQEVAEARLVLDDQDPGARRHGPHPSRADVQES